MDQTSQVDPLTLLEKISKDGISQDVYINDLGNNLEIHDFDFFSFSPPTFCLIVFPSVSDPFCTYSIGRAEVHSGLEDNLN